MLREPQHDIKLKICQSELVEDLSAWNEPITIYFDPTSPRAGGYAVRDALSMIVILAVMFISYFFLFALVIFHNKSQKL